ncbi:MAG: single-stranded-DNA-specific exonuclease RecJ [Gammaproteobacteria bacterium]|nr:single-stranded-DNA-specific exonuclease RecJ [Gammaproteobacteria bacterium]
MVTDDSMRLRAAQQAGPPEIRCRPARAQFADALPPDLHPVLRRVLAAREVTPAQLRPGLARLLPVGDLPGVAAAADRLADARAKGERVLVIGDFDADGATATALAITCLRAFGFAEPGFLVPDRFLLGYGLSPGIAELAAARGPGLLLTVDNGITSLDGIRRARELGMEVLVTDHHLPGPELPDAACIVNPNLPGSGFGSPALCGVGVAFYLMAATGRRLAELGLVAAGAARDAVTACLDLVALGTVADLVALDFNNRILVAEGLRRIRSGRTRPGIEALFRVAGRDPASARSGDLGFAIAPRLNAAGRLTDMTLGIECLLAPDAATARGQAAQLDALNAERRSLQEQMQDQAEELLADLSLDSIAAGGAACLFDERWHPGIVGLVASRVREMTGGPAIAFARATEPGMLRGSARSVDGIHVRDLIANAVARLPRPGIRYGGHAMAAGITIPEADLPAFRRAFGAELERLGHTAGDAGIVWTDGGLEPGELQIGVAEALAAAGPWGQAFPEPLFDNLFAVREQRVVGDRHLRLRVQHRDGGPVVDAIAFRHAPLASARNVPARLVYRLDVNLYRDARTTQLVVEHLECV